MDTPEVYSRNRLVNDRFRQDAWLRKKLDENPTQGLQGSTATSNRSNTAFSVALAFPEGTNTESKAKPQSSPEPQAPTQVQTEKTELSKALQDTPIEEFRNVMAYREEIRNEILENQLDDRHDIAGNTLYRLKFDATVVPLQDTSAYAMVEVTISGPLVWNISEDDEKPRVSRVSGDMEVPDEGMRLLLEESQYARYVAGLDETTFKLYRKAYDGWITELKLDGYSEEDITYGPLQGYLWYESGNDPPFEEKRSEWLLEYDSEADLEAARKILVDHGVPAEYHFIAGEEGGPLTLGVNTGLANFISDLREHKSAIYTYAVTPKERVQRVYGNTFSAGTQGVSVGLQQSGIGAKLGHSTASEAQANAIMRQPQLVGYSAKAERTGEATMGWLIGPRYKISNDSSGLVSFRHVPTQHTLTAIISVPSWWTELNLVTKTYWLNENGLELLEGGREWTSGLDEETGKLTTIALPADISNIVDILDPKRREPKIYFPTETTDLPAITPGELVACEPGSVVIRGSQLWRSTVVTLGAQQADSISVLPNMKGIIATFDKVSPSISGTEALYLWTSEGEANVGDISVGRECTANPAT